MADQKPDKDAEKWATALAEARKGKPRSFAILAKGSTVLGLMVAKRIGSGDILARKADLKATKVIEGVVLGNGQEVVFHTTADVGLKVAVLRAWITESFGLKIKPAFAVVADLALVGKKPAGKVEDKDADKTKEKDKEKAAADKPDRKAQTQKKKLAAQLAGIVKTRADVLRADAKAAKLLKPIKAALDEGKLDLAEKAIRALDTATKKAAAGNV